MTEPTISCPQCKTQIKLTESLAAPLVEATRREYEERLEQSNAEFVSQALPNVDAFEFIDGIWVTHPRTMILPSRAFCGTA